MSLVISDEILRASGFTENQLFLEVILLLFQQEKLSLGKAAELLNMSQIRFQRLVSDRGLCVHYDVAEFREDVQHLTGKGLL
jgi:predicted HTH domain antitoxin